MNHLSFVVCVNNRDTLRRCLLASPCIARGDYALTQFEGCSSAAEAFNAALQSARSTWLVFVHQDVFLPQGWDQQFLEGIKAAWQQFKELAVVGVYGVQRNPSSATQQNIHVGHVLDRGRLLKAETPLPARADTLDELCFAVRCDSGLRLDAALGFDFYAADIALQAVEQGFSVVVVDAYCEHHSSLPRRGFSEAFVERFGASATVFQKKWQHRLPISTPCITLTADSAAEIQVRAAAGQVA